MDNIAIILIGICIFAILLACNLHNRTKYKIQKLTDAGYPIRKMPGIASGFGDGIAYEFFINGEWLDTHAAFKHLNS